MYANSQSSSHYQQRTSTGVLIAAFLVLLFVGGAYAWENIWD
ncbi:hypothetical protein SAMN04489762_0331 [Terribacillus saccharophilus]|uniref:Uncharacterized protein n=1 Tax=Terribacillus saccharophilus TaxID=361277 RepID=A0AAX2EA87_9BACI|nr:hypothetical protein [Terribacillus saccharophilus]SEM53958.1 hypothetical protein SAMN04489762_0331 [Terribacillus saccharophilus]